MYGVWMNSVSQDSDNYTILIFGFGDVVKHKYLQQISSADQKKIAFVDLTSTSEPSRKVLIWRSPELDKFVSDNPISKIIVAKVIEYVYKAINKNKLTIYVEKPFLDSLSRYLEIKKLTDKNSLYQIYCLDHYLAKPTVLWLKRNIDVLISDYGKISSLTFESFEKSGFGNFETFEIGYALEHGVHALPVFESIVGKFFIHKNQINIKQSHIEPVCIGENTISNNFDIKLSVSEVESNEYFQYKDVDVNICGGKLHKEDSKNIYLEFESMVLKCGINTGRVESLNNSDFRTYQVSNNTDAYRYLLTEVLSDKHDKSMFLTPEDAMKSVELIQLAMNNAG